jgi:hypothetical protein
VLTARSSPGSTTTPGTPCPSPPTTGSPAQSYWPPSAPPAGSTASRRPRSPAFNGLVFTTRLVGGRGGRTALETELCCLGVEQKNGKPDHPRTQSKAERFQQTLKNWLRAQPAWPATLAERQTLLDAFAVLYNTRRPHRSLPHRAVPAVAYAGRPMAAPETRPPALTTASAPTASTPTARSPSASAASSTTSASAAPVPVPAHPSSPPDSHPDPNQKHPEPVGVQGVLDVLRHHRVRREGLEPPNPLIKSTLINSIFISEVLSCHSVACRFVRTPSILERRGTGPCRGLAARPSKRGASTGRPIPELRRVSELRRVLGPWIPGTQMPFHPASTEGSHSYSRPGRRRRRRHRRL